MTGYGNPRHTLYLSANDPAKVAAHAAASAEYATLYADGAPEPSREDRDALAARFTAPVAVRELCPTCGREHDALWTVRRVIADTLGPWNVYRIAGGAWTFPGGGLPLTLDRLPRDAVRLAPESMAAFWHAED